MEVEILRKCSKFISWTIFLNDCPTYPCSVRQRSVFSFTSANMKVKLVSVDSDELLWFVDLTCLV